MTTHYIDIALRPDPEISAAHVLGTLYAKLHRALVHLRATDIGVSFPLHRQQPRTLGDILRLHGSEAALAQLMQDDWLRGVHDHVALSDLARVPAQAHYRVVQRRQFKTSAERLRRRRMRRKGETADEALAAIPASIERSPNLPYVQLRSASTGQTFCLFIEHGPLAPAPSRGEFSAYGLSSQATIPWFDPFFSPPTLIPNESIT